MYLNFCGGEIFIWGQEKFCFTIYNLFYWFSIDPYTGKHSQLKLSIYPVGNFIFISYNKMSPVDKD